MTLSTPQWEVLDHLRRFGPTWWGVFPRHVVKALVRKGLVVLQEEGRLVLADDYDPLRPDRGQNDRP